MFGKYLLLAFTLVSNLGSATGSSISAIPNLNENRESTARVAPYVVRKTLEIWVTAYSSTPEETDDTPFITASGSTVREGVVATNLFPFGTKVLIPEYFGERVFVVEDRMHSRKTNNLDIWMASKQEAKKFGISQTKIVVLE
ncbi:MAG: hypothetical protein G01um101420_269 [Parcubacteria group bacterium Gr01-1014_20]|nr:MAG: hypothetical protein G01um101420_269 [Parcubacteria group bacterium Gr01-1014_20]